MMIGIRKTTCRHQAESELLHQALAGDLGSVGKMLNYLSSSKLCAAQRPGWKPPPKHSAYWQNGKKLSLKK
jgi:hypothetical protein